MDIGVEFSHYTVVEHVGRGGMADVWSARDRRLSRTVAIKTILRDMSADAEPVKLFEREAKMIAQLEHPHILPIYDFGEFEAQLYIVMRYVTGGSLEDLLAAGPIPLQEVMRYARAIATALDYAHKNKVIHLDLKPSNILLDATLSPYLADFGLAAVLGPEGRAANPGYGTLLYMAPEQLTSGEIDHRADVYSFTILLFQMLTGELPFDATTSLALKQLQWQEDLPDLRRLSPELSATLTPILRYGTAMEAGARPSKTMELVEKIEAALAKVGAIAARTNFDSILLGGMGESEEAYIALEGDAYAATEAINLQEAGYGATFKADSKQEDLAKLEALDIYNKARRAWAHGQGRFLLGVTHFMLMNDFYRKAAEWQLELDEAGMQMLLRGALEYDHDVDFWWNKLGHEDRRWVTLHAIRSENAPARERALYRLETLPDSEPTKIPQLVAQALALETNEAAKRAAVHVLATRARLLQASGVFIKPRRAAAGVTARLLTARTRDEVQHTAPQQWLPEVFNNEIDTLLAEVALEPTFPAVAEQAARTIGRIRSLAGVKYLATAHQHNVPGALRALALVRDESPALPNVVNWQAQMYAWWANTWRRWSDQPMQMVWRVLWAMIGGAFGMAYYVWGVYTDVDLFNADRWGATVSIGLTFGVLVALMTVLAGEIPARVRGFWPLWLRVAFSALSGLTLGALTWGGFTWFFLKYPPQWDIMAYGGAALAVGLLLSTVWALRGWLLAALTGISLYWVIGLFGLWGLGVGAMPLPLTAESLNYPASLLYLREESDLTRLVLMMVIILVVGMFAQGVWRDSRDAIAWVKRRIRRG